jgi:hypothetical protein
MDCNTSPDILMVIITGAEQLRGKKSGNAPYNE